MFIHIHAAKINNKFKKQKTKQKILYLKNKKKAQKENDNRIKIHLLSENNKEGTNRNQPTNYQQYKQNNLITKDRHNIPIKK